MTSAAVPADPAIPELTHVDAGGHLVAYRRAGHGPPIVFLHGFLCDSRCWRTQLAGLSEDFSVVAWDAPGAGASPDPAEPFTITDWAHVLVELLDRLEIERAPVVGLSWGGLLAQELYRLYPTRVAGLILADTYAGWKGSFSEDIARQRLERCVRESSLPPAEFAARWVPEFFTEAASRELRDEMSSVVSDFHPRGLRLMATSLAVTDTTELLPGIEAPTLLLWGDDDRRSPLSVAERFREAIPGAVLAVIPDAGHVSNMERPDVFNGHVRRFCLGG